VATWQHYQTALARLNDLPQQGSAARIAERRQAAGQVAERARQRLLATGVLDAADLIVAVPVAPQPSAAGELCFSAAGAVNEIVLDKPPAAAAWTSASSAALFAAAALALLALWRLRRASDWLAEHAHLALAAAGLSWWLLAPWGAAGWLAVLAAAWLALRWHWPRGGYDVGSTIRRLAPSWRGQG
jgi:O-antigen ligase